MNTTNVNSALRTLNFVSSNGHQVLVDPSGMTTRVNVTDEAQTHRFILKDVVKNGDGYQLLTTAGAAIQVSASDGLLVRAIHDQNLPRQKAVRLAKNVFLVVFGCLILLIIAIASSSGK